jgi:hypothetical protein
MHEDFGGICHTNMLAIQLIFSGNQTIPCTKMSLAKVTFPLSLIELAWYGPYMQNEMKCTLL